MDKRLRFMADLIEPLMVAPGSTVRLGRDHDPGYTGEVTRQQATALLSDGVSLLADYQDRLAAQDTYGVLLILQGLDASGKDSTIGSRRSGSSSASTTQRRTGSSRPATSGSGTTGTTTSGPSTTC
jgi:hypothetical protein